MELNENDCMTVLEDDDTNDAADEVDVVAVPRAHVGHNGLHHRPGDVLVIGAEDGAVDHLGGLQEPRLGLSADAVDVGAQAGAPDVDL